MRHRRITFWTVLIMCAVVAGLLLTGCDNLLGEDDPADTGEDTGDGGDPVTVEDGSLTASVSGVPMDLESTTEGDEDLLFAAFVFEAGTDVLDDSWEDKWVALVAEEIVDGSATGTAFQTGDDSRPEWVGTDGESYDVYCTVYRVTFQEEGPPTKGGESFFLVNPECVHGTVDWQSPITYQQDGDHSLTSSYGEYLDTCQVEFSAQGALGLVGLVMNSLPEGGPPEAEPPVELELGIKNITVTMTQRIEDESSLYVELEIDIDGYIFPDTDLDPEPTADGIITLSILAPIVDGEPQEPQELGFTTSNLVLSQGEDVSVAVEMDGSATDMNEEGPQTFTGSFTCDGAVHDLAIMTEMYNIP